MFVLNPQANSGDSSTLVDIESTISELTFKLEKTNSDFGDSEEILLGPPTISTLNQNTSDRSATGAATAAAAVTDDDNENTITKMSTENITKTADLFNIINDESDDSAYIIPIKIILPAPHIHARPDNGTFEQFNYILLQTNDSAYHAHLANDKPDILYPEQSEQHQQQQVNVTRADAKPPTDESDLEILDFANNTNAGGGSGSGAGPTSPSSLLPTPDTDTDVANFSINLIDSDGFRYQRTKQYRIMDDNGDVAVEFEEVAAIRPVEEIFITSTTAKSMARQQSEASNDEQYDEHYSKILQWILYKL